MGWVQLYSSRLDEAELEATANAALASGSFSSAVLQEMSWLWTRFCLRPSVKKAVESILAAKNAVPVFKAAGLKSLACQSRGIFCLAPGRSS